MNKKLLFYILMLLVFGIAMAAILQQGRSLEAEKVSMPAVSDLAQAQPATFFSNFKENIHHPLAVLIIQIFCIMIVARLFGMLMVQIGQPSVVGEIIAGIALGPSLMGALLPEFSSFLFPEESLSRLHVLSQVGLVLFMFIIGMELDVGILKKKAHAAVVVSHVSIIFPCFLGIGLAYFLYETYAPANVSFIAFALFMGIAMSITAFPVLARIVQERNLTQTPIGTVVITCAAADDITAWCLLALVVAIVTAGGLISVVGSISMALIYVVVMWFIVRPILHQIAVKYDTAESVNKTVVAIIFSVLLLSSFMTEIIGIHALFGAFLAGVIMPTQKEFKRILTEKIEDVSLVLFLPLFFVFTGLRTEIGLLNQPHLWQICFLIIAIAVVGKFVGSAVAAKVIGQNWKDSLYIGVLMNARGLMELVVLNIGYDLGVLSSEIFTMMVLMALATTFMTGPVLHLIDLAFRPKEPQKEKKPEDGFQSLLSFGAPRSGGRLLELAYFLNMKNEKDSAVTAVHFSPSTDLSLAEAEQYRKEAFVPVHYTATRLGIDLKTISGVTDNVEREILRTAHRHAFDIALVGASREIFTSDRTGGKVRSFIQQLPCPVGVLIDQGFRQIKTVLVLLGGKQDMLMLKYAERFLAGDPRGALTLVDPWNVLTKDDLRKLVAPQGNFSLITTLPENKETFYRQFDLVLVTIDYWDHLKKDRDIWLRQMPSVLIINK